MGASSPIRSTISVPLRSLRSGPIGECLALCGLARSEVVEPADFDVAAPLVEQIGVGEGHVAQADALAGEGEDRGLVVVVHRGGLKASALLVPPVPIDSATAPRRSPRGSDRSSWLIMASTS